MKKGISLIVLIITIIVVIILAGAVILSLNDTNVIDNAKEATFLSDFKTVQSKVLLATTENIFNNENSISLGKEVTDYATGADVVAGIDESLSNLITVIDGIIYCEVDEGDMDASGVVEANLTQEEGWLYASGGVLFGAANGTVGVPTLPADDAEGTDLADMVLQTGLVPAA